MKLVDLDVEIDRICNEVCGHDREHCMWKAYGEEEGCNQIQELEKAKAIAAIPVGWLIDRANDPKRAPLYRRYAQMLYEEWQKEQEAR